MNSLHFAKNGIGREYRYGDISQGDVHIEDNICISAPYRILTEGM